MKCQACNANLSIEDEKCPYCGTPNPEAVQHRKDMLRFSKEFQSTRSSVLKMASDRAGKSARIIALCVMVLLCILSILFFICSWDMAYSVRKLKAANNSKTYCKILDQYEEEGDFLSFAAFFDQSSLYSIDAFKEYRYVYNAASNYTSIYGYISRLIEDEHWEDIHENTLEYLCDTLEYHYKYLERDPEDYYSEIGAYEKRHLQAVDQINEKIESLIQFTFDISDEEMEQFQTLSTIEKQAFIERRFKDYE